MNDKEIISHPEIIKDLPTLNSEELRATHPERFIQSQEKLAKAEEQKGQNTRFMWVQNLGLGVYMWLAVFLIVVLILILLGALMFSKSQFVPELKNVFHKPYVCTYEGKNMSFNVASLALDFKELFPNAICDFTGVRT